MIPLEYELNRISEVLFEMFDLTRTQVDETKQALVKTDCHIAESVIRRELRINALEITIDRDCENLLACYNPVAADLRFVISAIKIGESLERIGDHAYRIAKYVQNGEIKKESVLLNELGIGELFDIISEMVANCVKALEEQNAETAKNVFKQDKQINKAKRDSIDIIKKALKNDIENTRTSLHLFSIIGKLERCGDMLKNVAEEIVFYIEAEVLKHQKRNQKIIKRLEKGIEKPVTSKRKRG